MTILTGGTPSFVGGVSYTELKAAVERYTENTFEDTDFATMTKYAEQRIYNSVQLPAQRKTVAASLTPGSNILALPTDFLFVYSLAVVNQQNEYLYLLNKDVDFLREAYPAPATGLPKYYALYGPAQGSEVLLQAVLAPTPNASYTVELNYGHYPESIVSVDHTWLGDNFSIVLFNAVMVEAARFMKQEADIVAMMDKEYAQSLVLLKNLADGKNRQDTYRSGQVRNKVV